MSFLVGGRGGVIKFTCLFTIEQNSSTNCFPHLLSIIFMESEGSLNVLNNFQSGALPQDANGDRICIVR